MRITENTIPTILLCLISFVLVIYVCCNKEAVESPPPHPTYTVTTPSSRYEELTITQWGSPCSTFQSKAGLTIKVCGNYTVEEELQTIPHSELKKGQ